MHLFEIPRAFEDLAHARRGGENHPSRRTLKRSFSRRLRMFQSPMRKSKSAALPRCLIARVHAPSSRYFHLRFVDRYSAGLLTTYCQEDVRKWGIFWVR